jgi:hypothetical protein
MSKIYKQFYATLSIGTLPGTFILHIYSFVSLITSKKEAFNVIQPRLRDHIVNFIIQSNIYYLKD